MSEPMRRRRRPSELLLLLEKRLDAAEMRYVGAGGEQGEADLVRLTRLVEFYRREMK